MPAGWNAANPARRSTMPRLGVFRPKKVEGNRPGRLRAEWLCYLCAIFLSTQKQKQGREAKSRKERKARTGDTDYDTVK